jgi:hypothetical protein
MAKSASTAETVQRGAAWDDGVAAANAGEIVFMSETY